MNNLRKIPLEMLINILEDLYNSGANFVDISTDTDKNNNLKDTIKITVKPEYIDCEDDDINTEEKVNINWQEIQASTLSFSEKDINDLI